MIWSVGLGDFVQSLCSLIMNTEADEDCGQATDQFRLLNTLVPIQDVRLSPHY